MSGAAEHVARCECGHDMDNHDHIACLEWGCSCDGFRYPALAVRGEEGEPSEVRAESSVDGTPADLELSGSDGSPSSSEATAGGEGSNDEPCACGHPRGWHRFGQGACVEDGCTEFRSALPALAALVAERDAALARLARQESASKALVGHLAEQLEAAREALWEIARTPCEHGYEAEPERFDCVCGACQNERLATHALAVVGVEEAGETA